MYKKEKLLVYTKEINLENENLEKKIVSLEKKLAEEYISYKQKDIALFNSNNENDRLNEALKKLKNFHNISVSKLMEAIKL